MRRSILGTLALAAALAGCGTSHPQSTTRTVTRAAVTVPAQNPSHVTTTHTHKRRPVKHPERKATPPANYASTYPHAYRTEQIKAIEAMQMTDPSLESKYAHCVINTLMRTVPYAVQQHTEPAVKAGLPLDWWTRLIERCNAASP